MNLLLTIWRLVQFRAGPDELPASIGFLIFVLGITVVVNIAQLTATLDVEHAAEQTGAILIVTFLFVYMLLRWNHLLNRYVQTITSILCASLLINAILIPLVILAPNIFDEQNPEMVRLIGTVMYLILLFFVNLWMVLVMGYIFSRAINSSLFTGVVATMALFGVNMLVLTQLFPV